ncbi:unnamed protein product, partial [Rotaria sp. Silwood2]
GTKTGILALYDLKTPKYQPFQAQPKNVFDDVYIKENRLRTEKN